MIQAGHPTLIASPQVPFGELRQQLAHLGWQMESATKAPLLPGEPELAVFVHGQEAAVIHYTFNPVVALRVLQFRGANAGVQQLQVGGGISVLSPQDLRALLTSGDVKQLLLGLFAAGELAEIGVIEPVTRLCSHSDDRVAHTADRVRDSLFTKAAACVSKKLDAEQARNPERSAWFTHLPQSELRKQVLRWLMRDSESSSPSIDQVLRSALQDLDPEVRVTAVLAAAKLKATNLIAEVRAADIPRSSSLGADDRDRFFYERLRQTAVGYLAISDRAEGGKEAEKRRQFQQAVAGELDVRDDPTLLLYSLTTPVHLGEKPARLPEAVEDRGDVHCLRRSGITLRWIAAVPHWLGEDSARALSPNPIRQVTPEAGFFIAELPISSELALWTSDARQPPPPAGQAETKPFVCGYDEAEHLCQVLGHLEGVDLQLPAADQWEMAARGTDGRRYSWGNSLRESGYLQPSPWLVKNMVGRVYEWTRDRDDAGHHIVCGGLKSLACARREAVGRGDRGAQCVVRPVMMWAGK